MGSQAMSGRVTQQLARGLSLLQKHGSGLSAPRSGSQTPYGQNAAMLSQIQSRSFDKAVKPSRVGRRLTSRGKQEWGSLSPLAGFDGRSECNDRGAQRAGFSVRASAEAQMAMKNDAGMASVLPPLEEKWEIKMLYDGECPLCMREVSTQDLPYRTSNPVSVSSDLTTFGRKGQPCFSSAILNTPF